MYFLLIKWSWQRKIFLLQIRGFRKCVSFILYLKNFCVFLLNLHDRSERHNLWPWLWLFSFPFLFPPKKVERIKGEWITKIVIKSQAFLLDQFTLVLYNDKKRQILLNLKMIILNSSIYLLILKRNWKFYKIDEII